jgi:hypothetical protein
VPALQILARLMAWAGPHPFRWWGLWLLSLIPIAAVAAMVSAAAGVSFQTARGYVLVAVAVVALLTWYLTRDTRAAEQRKERKDQARQDYSASLRATGLAEQDPAQKAPWEQDDSDAPR